MSKEYTTSDMSLISSLVATGANILKIEAKNHKQVLFTLLDDNIEAKILLFENRKFMVDAQTLLETQKSLKARTLDCLHNNY